MQPPNSPLFPPQKLTLSSVAGLTGDEVLRSLTPAYIPLLPDKPLAHTSSIQIYIIPAEETLFVQGFDTNEYSERPPTLLRGCLCLRVLKPSKIKSISVLFKGQQRTDWPEGIPPKKNTFVEVNDVSNHTWPFYHSASAITPNNGADYFRELPKSDCDDVSHLTLSETITRSASPSISRTSSFTVLSTSTSSNFLSAGSGNFLSRALSPSGILRKAATSPANDSLTVPFTDLTSMASTDDPNRPGYFAPGDYFYNFEHPLHPSVPETCSVTFGACHYWLEASIIRIGTFKSNITARLPIEIVRAPSDENHEENEPIVINRDWEDQLRYDIVIGAKSTVLNSYLPLAFRFVPLWGKVQLHRIRVYLSENLEYYCNDKKVHRMEPPKKYLLLEHKAQKGKSLLSDDTDEDDVLPKELEFQVFIPKVVNRKSNHEIHPDTSFENIQAHHWIKICLRISRMDPEKPETRKHYEISIDSPIHILSHLAAHGNTLLPAYDNVTQVEGEYLTTPPMSPEVEPVGYTVSNLANNLANNFSPIAGSSSNNSANNFTNSYIPHLIPGNITSSFNGIESHLDGVLECPHFDRIHSLANNDEPIARDGDMHLDSNLYKPEENQNPNMSSPQAVPHPGTFSPIQSAIPGSPSFTPILRPIHLLRKPSINPPPFGADLSAPGLDSAPPPAYEEEDPGSLSPLRIDDSAERTNSHTSTASTASNHETPIRLMLNRQLRTSEELINGQHLLDNLPLAETLELIDNLVDTLEEYQAQDLVSETDVGDSSYTTDDTNIHSLHAEPASPQIYHPAPKSSLQLPSVFVDEEDITDCPISPINPTQAMGESGSRALSPLRRNLRSRRSSEGDFSPSERKLRSLHRSERSSISSLGSSIVDAHVDQTIPLLSLSTSTLSTVSDTNLPLENRNGSQTSLLYDLSVRRAGSIHFTKLHAILDNGDLAEGALAVSDKLLQLRNPRIARHYQNDKYDESFVKGDGGNESGSRVASSTFRSTGAEHESAGPDSPATADNLTSNSMRHKSFGVTDLSNDIDSYKSGSSTECETVLLDDAPKTSSNRIKSSSNVPGFNYDFII